ncbi:nucleoside hydrolase [Ruania rhizosphaerae]|uniref:nucleoside hydrolase n=1 Tax=Ruania rhizosphaerae TaxID=1840413 RepID=UPI001357DEDB|nr:nucleoside hydrolase [Ruania rhizosphaerae]
MPARWTIDEFPWLERDVTGTPEARVIVDNDFAGDPDDLYHVVHHLLTPSVDTPLLVASHLAVGDRWDPSGHSAANAATVLGKTLELMGLDPSDRVVTGSEVALTDRTTPHDTPAARAIIAEAMRESDTPLFYAAGGGLTDLASAYLLEPRIADRLTLVWIGGPEYAGHAYAPDGAGDPEYNLNIDVTAAQVLFNDSTMPIWQVPRNIYRQCLVSDTELRRRVKTKGALGEHLYQTLRDVAQATGSLRSETYALGDQPLILLTGLQSFFQPDTTSSDYAVLPAPIVEDSGRFVPTNAGRSIRVYTRVDVRLMFEDMFLRLDEFTEWLDAEPSARP